MLLVGDLRVNRGHWGKSGLEILYTIILGLVPLWMGAILLWIFAPQDISKIIDFREIVLFSTALLAMGFFYVGQEFKKTQFPGRSWFLLVLVVLLVLSTSLFSGMLISGYGNGNSDIAQSPVLQILSIFILLVSILFVFLVSAMNKAMVSADIQPEDALDKRSSQLEKLDKEIDDFEAGFHEPGGDTHDA